MQTPGNAQSARARNKVGLPSGDPLPSPGCQGSLRPGERAQPLHAQWKLGQWIEVSSLCRYRSGSGGFAGQAESTSGTTPSWNWVIAGSEVG